MPNATTPPTAHEQMRACPKDRLAALVLAAVVAHEATPDDPPKSTSLVWSVYRAAGLKHESWDEPAAARVLRAAEELAGAGKLVKYKRGDSYPSLLRRLKKPGGGEPRWATPERDRAARAAMEAARDEQQEFDARQAAAVERAAGLGVAAAAAPGGVVLSLDALQQVLDRLSGGDR